MLAFVLGLKDSGLKLRVQIVINSVCMSCNCFNDFCHYTARTSEIMNSLAKVSINLDV